MARAKSILRFLASSAVAGALAGCTTLPAPSAEVSVPPATPVVLTPDQTAVIQGAVLKDFKDPASAQFRGLRASQHQAGITVCGEVNGKNSYGGYIGYLPFIAYVNQPTGRATLGMLADAQNEFTISGTLQLCKKEGL